LLDRLGRRNEAVNLVEALRVDAPQDRALAALHARLLIAQGQPGRARTVLLQ
jgi:predicted Zn-dependent protease